MFKDRFILAATTVSLVAMQIMLWLLILKSKNLPTEVIFWYTKPVANQLAPVQYVWIMPAIALSCWLINLGLSYWLYQKHSAISRLLSTSAVFICLLTTIAVVKTILIYTSIP
jgi:hypothetical protein